MISTENKLILVADAHLNDSGTDESFFRMLDRISALPSSYPVVFLGDIYDLWFALPWYESESQKRFLQWCKEEKQKRIVYFLEGNHEFFVAQNRKKYFTAIHSSRITMGNLQFLHGDRINSADWKYFLLRMVLRNPITALAMIIGHSIGMAVAWKIREKLRHTNQFHKKTFPEKYVRMALRKAEKKKIHTLIAGHFHHAGTIEEKSCLMYILPAYAVKGEIGLYDTESGELKIDTPDHLLTERNLS